MLRIFDLDGVILNSSWEFLFDAYKALLAHCGKRWQDFFDDLECFKKWWNPDWQESNKSLGIEESEEGHQVFYKAYNPCVYFLPFMEEILKQLYQKHLLAIFTNRHRHVTRELFGSMEKFFEIIVGIEDVTRIKPDPEGIEIILNHLGVSQRDQVVMIGDTPEDLMAGKRAGIKTAAVIWEYGLGNDEKFSILDFKPDYIIRKSEDFLLLL